MSKAKMPAPALRFKTRNYKHELRLTPGTPRWVGNYTDAMWEAFFRQVAARDFTGVVFYAGYHPFEFILDYSGYPQAATQPAGQNAATRDAINRGLAVAKRYGLKTMIQHYVTHYTEPLARHLRLPMTGRYANTGHPELDRYHRWCYREIFKQCSDLSGMYFNYESSGNNWSAILRTAVAEFNSMSTKPIMVHRLWNLSDVEGVRALIKGYQGKTILSHKISDTNDTYYLPTADSRCGEWKEKLKGLDFEFIYCLGPCHNCGTNLCANLWADYDFVWDLAADAKKQGADGIGFHTVHEFFAPDMPGADKLYSEREMDLARLNVLHLDAFVDYVHGVRKSPAQRAARMAERMGVPAAAGKPLVAAIEAASRPVLLTFRQFCYGSAFDGYLNPGRYSHIQDPFYYYPATEMNNQASRAMWSCNRCDVSWLKKERDRKVCPDNQFQYIIDFVNPKKAKAVHNPEKLASMIDAVNRKALAALASYRRLVGDAAADLLERHMKPDVVLGEYVACELRAAVHLYGIYFATSKAQVVSRLRSGLTELRGVKESMQQPEEVLKVVLRDFMFDLSWGPDREIALASETLSAVESTDFPAAAFAAYVGSRREYNEIRRVCRAAREQNERTLAFAAGQFKAAMRLAKQSLKLLRDDAWRGLAANVESWLAFLESEFAAMTPPSTTVGAAPGEWLATRWEHAFRSGENFLEDFLSFFKSVPAGKPSIIRFRVWRTADALAVTMREDGVDPEQRKARWVEHMSTGSSSFVERLVVDVMSKDRPRRGFIIWPKGESVSMGDEPNVAVKTEYREAATAYETTAYLPFALIGKPPKKGDTWRFNIAANPAVTRNACFTWALQYDAGGNTRLFGRLKVV